MAKVYRCANRLRRAQRLCAVTNRLSVQAIVARVEQPTPELNESTIL
jgi:hypothetical protein